MKILITGGAGFIGSAMIRHLLSSSDDTVINVDKLTYAGHLASIEKVTQSPNYHFQQVDITDAEKVSVIFSEYHPDAVIHFAAESHVDKSIDKPSAFINTNILGTYTLLEQSRKYYFGLNSSEKNKFRFHHISTDEVFGSLGSNGYFREDSPYKPNSPYSASKAASDHLVRAWHETYALPVVITNCSNNYGPYQFPEKLIPTLVLNAIAKKDLPIYGDGGNVRDWLHVEDHIEAILHVLIKGYIGETYNIGGNAEKTNLQIANAVCGSLDKHIPKQSGSYKEQITFVEDRPGHDRRYAIDCSKIKTKLGWSPNKSFEKGIDETVLWYLNNLDWCEKVMADNEVLNRKGLANRL